MKAYGSVAISTITAVDHGIPLPKATRSDRDIFADLERAHSRISPIQLQPLTRDQLETLHDVDNATHKPAPRRKTPTRALRQPAVDTAQVIACYRDGMSVLQVATHLNCGINTVRSRLRMSGEPLRRQGSGIDQPTIDAILAAYQSGLTTTQVGAQVGCSPMTVRKYVEQAGITLRNDHARSRPRGASQQVGEPYVKHQAILTAYQAGQTVPQIATTFGHTAHTIRRHINASGIPKRDDRALGGGANKRVDPPALVTQLRELYLDQGHSIVEVAQLLHTTAKVIQTALVRNGIERRPAVPRIGADNAVDLKALMAANTTTAAQVRTWAQNTGRPCAPQGLPPRHLVEAYLLLHCINPARKATA